MSQTITIFYIFFFGLIIVGEITLTITMNAGMIFGWHVNAFGEVVSILHNETLLTTTTLAFKDGSSYTFWGNPHLATGNHSFSAHYGWWSILLLDSWELTLMSECPRCHGTGYVLVHRERATCGLCDGRGHINRLKPKSYVKFDSARLKK
jgi:ribosomal protein S27AE